MKIITPILIFFLFFPFSCNNQRNEDFYDQALKDAQKHRKYVLLDFGAKWCGGCLAYDRYVFKDSLTMAKLAEKFILLKIDQSKPENSFLFKRYRITGIPHIVLINAEERILGSLNSFYHEFVETPDSFITKLEIIIKAQEKIKTLELAFRSDTTNVEAINNLLTAYQTIDQYIEIQHLNNLLVKVDPTPIRLFENNFNQVIHSLQSEGNTVPLMAFLQAHPTLDNDHLYEVNSQLMYYYEGQKDIKNQDIYYLKLFKQYPDYYKRKYADFLFENNLKVDTAIILAKEHNSNAAYNNFFWTYYLDAHILAYSGKIDLAVQSYSDWMEKNRQIFINEDEYWSFYFYAKFANIHNIDLERALEYVQIAEKNRNMIDEKMLMAEILYKLGRGNEAVEKLIESQELTESEAEYDNISRLIGKYGKKGMPKS